MDERVPDYSSEEIRLLVLRALTEQELTQICFDRFRTVYDRFGSEMGMATKVQLLIEYCDHQMCYPELLKEIKKYNEQAYWDFMSQRTHNAIGLQAEQRDDLEASSGAIADDYRKLTEQVTQPAHPRPDFAFRDRAKICAEILESTVRVVELTGPSGVGKTYLLNHIASSCQQDARVTYVNLSGTQSLSQILHQVIAQLDGSLAPEENNVSNAFARAVSTLVGPQNGQSITRFIFAFDSVTQAHEEVVASLIKPDVLLDNERLARMLWARGIKIADLDIKVVIAMRQPLLHLRHTYASHNISWRPLEVDRLRKMPPDNPILEMLQELAERHHFPLDRRAGLSISDDIYYLTGGHPKCCKEMLLDVAELDFAPLEADWQQSFKTHVFPTIQREMIGPILDPRLQPAFWVLSVFRGFDPPLLRTLLDRQLLAAQTDDQALQSPESQLRKGLMKTYLVSSPQVGERMHTINYTVRRALSLSMQYEFPDWYRKINSAALEIFGDRLQSADTAPDCAISSLIELVYHWVKALEMETSVTEDDICPRIQTALEQYLALLLTNNPDIDKATYLPLLQSHWTKDQELQEALWRATEQTECYESLSGTIDDFVARHI